VAIDAAKAGNFGVIQRALHVGKGRRRYAMANIAVVGRRRMIRRLSMTVRTTARQYRRVIHINHTGEGRRRNAMAIIAHIRRRRMRRTLGAANAARCVTVHALAGHHLRMIDAVIAEGRWRYAVTGFAGIGRLRMIARLADG